MRKPVPPPPTLQLLRDVPPERLVRIIATMPQLTTGWEYVHWDKLLRLPPPGDLTHAEWWLALKMNRGSLYRVIPLHDTAGQPFKFLLTDPLPEQLHQIDLGAGGRIGVPEPVTNPQTRDQYYVSSLIEEAITSSQLEGAATTREVAKEMLRTARAPRDRSEQMIQNNFRAMQQVARWRDEPLTRARVFEMHRLVTEGALDDPSAAARFRRTDEQIVVGDITGEVYYHVPPAAGELEERLAALCDFANGVTPDYFIHPAVRAVLLHFWLAYDHPFVDGNGRTARTLFYWSMLRNGFWLCEYLSISRVLLRAPAQYERAFLYTETDDNDLTYFLLHQMDVLRQATDDLHAYIERKSADVRAAEKRLRGMTLLNHRQRALISHALRHPDFRYTIDGHRLSHDVVYQTARTDLQDMEARGLLTARKVGRTWYFAPVPDLEARLRDLV